MALKSSRSAFDMNTHGVLENPDGRAKSNLVQNIIFNNPDESGYDSRVIFQDIDVTKITPRAVNQYRQNRIERLARSIQNTNNRLIHPIVLVRASDLPKDHEVLKVFEQRGIDTSKLEYIIVAGERRYRAWMLLREREAERLKGTIGTVNQFDTITANVLTHEEAYNEKVFFEDSNVEARQLTPLEGILHIRTALDEVKTPEQKREALVAMADGDETGIDADAETAARRFNSANYCLYYLQSELGIEGWSLSTIKAYMSVVNNSPDEVINAIIDGKYKVNVARQATALTHDEQRELMAVYSEQGQQAFKNRLDELKRGSLRQKVRTIVSAETDVRTELNRLLAKLDASTEKMSLLSDSLATADKKRLKAILKKLDGITSDIQDFKDNL